MIDYQFDPVKMGKLFQLVEDMANDVSEIKQDVKKQNGRVDKSEVVQAEHGVKIEALQNRPSATKAVITMGAIISILTIGLKFL